MNAPDTELEETKRAPMPGGEKKKLEEEVNKQAEEIKTLKAQLSDA